MSENEEKEKIEIKEPETRPITPWRPSDIFHAFDVVWDDFRRDFLQPWGPGRFLGRPWRQEAEPSMLMSRAAYTDLIDTGDAYHVCVEVPGISKDKLDVTITKDTIEISGNAKVEQRNDTTGYVIRERSYSEIFRKMAFPEEVIPEKAEATLKRGLLEITVPKKTPTLDIYKHKVEIN